MKRQYKTTICAIALGCLTAIAPSALPGAEHNRVEKAEVVARMAKDAKTPGDHSEVARQYELRAKALEVEAESIEREMRQQKANPSAMEVKWPAMVVNARERREQQAMQARRGAQESYRLAQHHRSLAGDSRDAE